MRSRANCTLVVAGPGSGKTRRMVTKALKCLPDLEPSRFLAITTYTNAAAEQIRQRLEKATELPPNVFIGTIHSFMYRFIIKPYARVHGLLPSEYTIVDSLDLSFLDRRTFTNAGDRNRCERAIENKKFKKGIITYNQIERKATELVVSRKKTVRRVLGNRLQFFFVDEIQDATTNQYNIIDNLRIEGKTQIYCIGDPEQYIYTFTYIDKKQKSPKFSNIPIKRLEAHKSVLKERISDEEENFRSTSTIVKFLNNFRRPAQKPVQRSQNELDVLFINKDSVRGIVETFNDLCDRLLPSSIRDGEKFRKYFLSYKNNTFEPAYAVCPMAEISNENCSSGSLLRMALEYILGASGLTLTDILRQTGMSLIEFRGIGMSVLRGIKENPNISEHKLRESLERRLAFRFKNEYQTTRRSFERLVSSLCTQPSSVNKNSSIHKAKGLEATAVLALAETKNRLAKWLETDMRRRADDKTDDCRIGFVAFSRAREFLCIGCLQRVDQVLLVKLRELGVVII